MFFLQAPFKICSLSLKLNKLQASIHCPNDINRFGFPSETHLKCQIIRIWTVKNSVMTIEKNLLSDERAPEVTF